MHESIEALQPYAFFGAMMCFAVAELFLPARPQSPILDRRWTTNLGLLVMNLGLQRLLLPISAFIVAQQAAKSEVGILHMIDAPYWLAVVVGLLVVDAGKYFEHRLIHAVPLLWRLHLVHHSDTDADFTTAERHHPIEVVFGSLTIYVVTLVFGVPPLAIAIFMLLGPADALFAHANIQIPRRVDSWLRLVIVTPAFHNVHHSAVRHETDSNFGQLLTIWDRVFGTYRRSTPEEDAARVIGLEYLRDVRSARLDRVLLAPFLPIGMNAARPRPDPEAGRPVSP